LKQHNFKIKKIMICILNILYYHPVSEATPNSKITGAYWTVIETGKIQGAGTVTEGAGQ
jgi:hypothetical protein